MSRWLNENDLNFSSQQYRFTFGSFYAYQIFLQIEICILDFIINESVLLTQKLLPMSIKCSIRNGLVGFLSVGFYGKGGVCGGMNNF